MQFSLTGFRQDAGSRVFTFQGTGTDRTHTTFSVSADMELSRVHGIRMQELPLLCLRFLEQHDSAGAERHLTFSEADMLLHANNCAAEREAAQKKKSSRKAPVNAGTRTEWAFPQPRQ